MSQSDPSCTRSGEIKCFKCSNEETFLLVCFQKEDISVRMLTNVSRGAPVRKLKVIQLVLAPGWIALFDPAWRPAPLVPRDATGGCPVSRFGYFYGVGEV